MQNMHQRSVAAFGRAQLLVSRDRMQNIRAHLPGAEATEEAKGSATAAWVRTLCTKLDEDVLTKGAACGRRVWAPALAPAVATAALARVLPVGSLVPLSKPCILVHGPAPKVWVKFFAQQQLRDHTVKATTRQKLSMCHAKRFGATVWGKRW